MRHGEIRLSYAGLKPKMYYNTLFSDFVWFNHYNKILGSNLL